MDENVRPETAGEKSTGAQVESAEPFAPDSPPSPESRTLLGEFGDYLMQNKKWWLIPIVVMLLVFLAFFLLATALPTVGPFVYTLF